MASFKSDLIRATFELTRDLEWVETLEPKFVESGVDAAAITGFREMWNRHCEERDWAWWQSDAKRLSVSELDDLKMDITEKLDALGLMRQQQNEQSKASRLQTLEQILKGARREEYMTQEPSREIEREM